MDCRDAQFYLRLRRHAADELGAEVTADLDRHLAACPGCAADARLVVRFDAAIGSTMRAVTIPPGLRDRLVANLSARRGTQLRRRAYRYVGVAAAMFLTVGSVYGFFIWEPRPPLDTHSLVMNLEERTDPDRAERQVNTWLVEQKLPGQLPERFDYRLYHSHGTERVQGRDVPVVVFLYQDDRGGRVETAKVYAFRESDYNLKSVPALAQASHWQAKAYPQDGRGVVFVVAFTTPDLSPFLRTHRSRDA